jgi:hypothetical protein
MGASHVCMRGNGGGGAGPGFPTWCWRCSIVLPGHRQRQTNDKSTNSFRHAGAVGDRHSPPRSSHSSRLEARPCLTVGVCAFVHVCSTARVPWTRWLTLRCPSGWATPPYPAQRCFPLRCSTGSWCTVVRGACVGVGASALFQFASTCLHDPVCVRAVGTLRSPLMCLHWVGGWATVTYQPHTVSRPPRCLFVAGCRWPAPAVAHPGYGTGPVPRCAIAEQCHTRPATPHGVGKDFRTYSTPASCRPVAPTCPCVDLLMCVWHIAWPCALCCFLACLSPVGPQ